jgi:hypothetical protein
VPPYRRSLQQRRVRVVCRRRHGVDMRRGRSRHDANRDAMPPFARQRRARQRAALRLRRAVTRTATIRCC